MKAAVFVVLASLLGLALASAKGLFQMQGKISAVEVRSDTLLFRFSGHIQFATLNRAPGATQSQSQNLEWEVERLGVRIRRWKRSSLPEHLRTLTVTFDEAAEITRKIALANHVAAIWIAEPKFSFRDDGELELLEGRLLEVHDWTELQAGNVGRP